jgi:hypothetical protein
VTALERPLILALKTAIPPQPIESARDGPKFPASLPETQPRGNGGKSGARRLVGAYETSDKYCIIY